jgi:uracil-DNA glycosylase
MISEFNFKTIDASWAPIIKKALARMDNLYLNTLISEGTWLPGKDKIFNAFSLPLSQVKFILFGESPYPREASANGYAFWDAAADGIWNEQGLSKTINRATSLRNLIKMLLLANHYLHPNNLSQEAIAALDKSHLIQSIDELFMNFMNKGVMLLNASLVLHHKNKNKDAKAWQPFMATVLDELSKQKPDVTLILLGNIAKQINSLPTTKYFQQFHAEHPYNCTFITNPEVLNFFRPFNLLEKQ